MVKRRKRVLTLRVRVIYGGGNKGCEIFILTK